VNAAARDEAEELEHRDLQRLEAGQIQRKRRVDSSLRGFEEED
jgi:hypothetical protein